MALLQWKANVNMTISLEPLYQASRGLLELMSINLNWASFDLGNTYTDTSL